MLPASSNHRFDFTMHTLNESIKVVLRNAIPMRLEELPVIKKNVSVASFAVCRWEAKVQFYAH